MAKSKDVKAGGAWVEIFADNSPLRRTLKASGQLLSKFAQPVLAASKMLATGFAIASTAAVAATKRFADYSDQIADMAGRTGASVKFLSELGYAAKMSGSELEAIEPAIRNMQKGLASGSSNKILEKLGLDPKTLREGNPESQFLAIADAISKIDSPAMRTAMAMQVFGKSGTALLPLLNEGSAGIEKMRQDARDLGISLDSEATAKAGMFNDALDRIGFAMQGVANVIGNALAPLLTWLAEAMIEQVSGLGKWLSSVLEFVGSYENSLATLKLAWVTTLSYIEGFWDTVISNLAPPIVNAFTYIEGFFDQVITNMLMGWQEVAAGMIAIGANIASSVGDSFRGLLVHVKGVLDAIATVMPLLSEGAKMAKQTVDQAYAGSLIAEYGLGKLSQNAAQEASKKNAEMQKGLESRQALRDNRMATAGDMGALEARRQARQAEIDAATAELQTTMQRTRDAAAQAAAEEQKRAQAVTDAASNAYGKTGDQTAGTFNAAAIFGLGASNVQVDMLRVLRDIAAQGEDLNQLVAEGGMA